MLVVFYDKDFVALQNNASLNVGRYSIKKRAVDYDEFSITSEAFVQDVNPCFVVLRDDYGRYKYAGFAGIPSINKDNQTELQGSDLKTLFNNEVLLQFGTYTYLYEMLTTLLNAFNTQVIQSSFIVEFNYNDILDIEIDSYMPSTELQVYNVWDVIQPFIKYYNCTIETFLDVANKKIVYSFKKTNNYFVPLKLWEHGITNYGKWVASINEAQGIVSCLGELSYGYLWILLNDNSITSTISSRNIYPIKRKVILKTTENIDEVNKQLSEANIEALTSIVQARFNESITLSSNGIDRFENANFDTTFVVYAKRGVFYKNIPLGEIYEDSDNKKTITIGYKPDDIVYFL